MDIERRVVEMEIRADDEGGISGYAAVFNSPSEDLGGFREIILPGAFAEALAQDTRALINHDPNLILGRTAAGTLRLSEDERGLRYEIEPPNTSYANDLRESIKRGDVSQSSFRFKVGEDDWTNENGVQTRYLKRIKTLFDVSPVTFPAYRDTVVSTRALSRAAELAKPDHRRGRVEVMKLKLDLADLEA